MALLSGAERTFIEGGVDTDLRADGRGRLDYRDFRVDTGLISQASGSGRVVLGSTDVLVGIKADVGEPLPEAPNAGRIQCSVVCAPSASQEFEGRGAEDVNAELSSFLQNTLVVAGVVDLGSLTLLEGVACWILSIDAMVLAVGGNVADALFLAVRAALSDLKIPNVTVKHTETDQPELDVSEDPDDVHGIPLDDVPVLVTLSKIGERNFVVDTTLQEEACVSASLAVAVNKKGHIRMIQKLRHGSLHTSHLNVMVTTAQKTGKVLISKLESLVSLQESASGPKRGFLS